MEVYGVARKPEFLLFASVRGISGQLTALTQSFWRFLMVVGLSEKNADNVYNAACYATFDTGCDGQNPDVRRGQPE